MDKLITTVNEYPFTSIFVFIAIYSIVNGIIAILSIYSNLKNKNNGEKI